MIGSSFTRGNNMDRSLMAVEIRAKDAEAMPSNPTSCHTCIVTDNILEIRMLEWWSLTKEGSGRFALVSI